MNRNIAQQLGIFLIITALSSGAALSQSIGKPQGSQAIKEHFNAIYKVDSRLISGDFYQPTMSLVSGHPFFINSDWKMGAVILDGIQYDNLLLRYDVSSNELILNTKNITSIDLQLILKKNHISYFEMDDRDFRPFPEKEKTYGSYFCEVLAHGKIDLILLKTKNLKVMGQDLDYKYQINQFRYLLLNEKVYRYRGRRILFKYFPELKAEIRDFIKINRLKYSVIKQDDLVKLISHCNLLLEEK